MGWATVEVDVDLSDFDTDDLIEELTNRGREPDSFETHTLVRDIYEKRRNGKDYQRELDILIYDIIGRI